MDRMSAAEFRRRYAGDHTPRTSVPHPKPAKQAAALGEVDARKTHGTGLPIIRFTLCRLQLLDADAKHGTLKDLLDGCKEAGLIQGDREDQICLEVEQVKVAHRNEQKTLIDITYP